MDADRLGELESLFRHGERESVQDELGKIAESDPQGIAGLLAGAMLSLITYQYAESLAQAEAASDEAKAADDKIAESAASRLMADALRMLDRDEESLSAAERARKAAEAVADKSAESRSLRLKADALASLERYEECHSAAEQALAAAQAAGDDASVSDAQRALGNALVGLREYEKALLAAEAAQQAAGAAGDKMAEANALGLKADVLRMLNRYEKSLSAAQASQKAARATGDKVAESGALWEIAVVLVALGRAEEALLTTRAAQKIAREGNDKVRESDAIRAEALALLSLDQFEESLKVAREAVEGEHRPTAIASALCIAAHALGGLGRDEESLSTARQALDEARKGGQKLAEANSLLAVASTLQALDEPEESVSFGRKALDAARAARDRSSECSAQIMIAEGQRRLGQHVECLSAAQAARDMARQADLEHAQRRALGLAVIALSELGRASDREPLLEDMARLDKDYAEALSTYPVKPGWFVAVGAIVREKAAREKSLRMLLGADPYTPRLPARALGCLAVLRKWASYTSLPILATQAEFEAAGGYFLWWQGWGVVVDPGLGFGRALRDAHFTPRNISAVIATHHHIDHTGDIPALATCLFEMNEDGEHEVDFVLGPGAFSALANGLAFVPGVRSIQLLRRDESAHFRPPGAGKPIITACKALHTDLTGREDATVGLRIELGEEGHTCTVGYTSDTGPFDKIGELYKDVALLVVHIGSVYPSDIGGYAEQRQHLGFQGVAKLLREAKAASEDGWNPFVLVSEWGEELRENRVRVCESLMEATGLSRVWPAELGAVVALSDGHAGPVCGMEDAQYAVRYDVGSEHDIIYMCAGHSHGETGRADEEEEGM